MSAIAESSCPPSGLEWRRRLLYATPSARSLTLRIGLVTFSRRDACVPGIAAAAAAAAAAAVVVAGMLAPQLLRLPFLSNFWLTNLSAVQPTVNVIIVFVYFD